MGGAGDGQTPDARPTSEERGALGTWEKREKEKVLKTGTRYNSSSRRHFVGGRRGGRGGRRVDYPKIRFNEWGGSTQVRPKEVTVT